MIYAENLNDNLVYYLSYTVTIAGLLQFIFLLIFVKKYFVIKINFNFKINGKVKNFFSKLLPSIFSSGVTQINILVGTHAILEDRVKFKNLGLAIIDEQHRFGVAQRSKLWHKNNLPPHVLVMTATPIPRTLAMSIYGDLDV